MITLHRQWWDNAWERERLALDATVAASALREIGHDVRIVDGDERTSHLADTADENEAVKWYCDELRDTGQVGLRCATPYLRHPDTDPDAADAAADSYVKVHAGFRRPGGLDIRPLTEDLLIAFVQHAFVAGWDARCRIGKATKDVTENASNGWREKMKSLPPEEQERVKNVIRKLLRAPRQDGMPPLVSYPSKSRDDDI